MKDFEAAIYHYKEVIKLDGRQEEAYINLGHIYNTHLQDNQMAYKVYKKILKLFPENKTAKQELTKIKK